MYRVAIILNESELLRSGYANVTPKLKSLDRLSRYSFETFTVVNITSLFIEGGALLHTFDSLLIGTNATSDRAVFGTLTQNAKAIADFLGAGKGIFISSQKKLSTELKHGAEGDGVTHFLPAHYEFQTVERPKAEVDSGVGVIRVADGAEDHLLLQYPETISAQMVTRRCERNEFRRHYYRSHLLPKSQGAYIGLLKDNSYREVPDRSLLMVGQSPQNGERLVISTIALDWAFHKELLTNIIVHVTEGAPKVAFVQKQNSRDGDYDFLLTSSDLAKIPHNVYSDAATIPKPLLGVHDTYIFAPGWSGEEITAFLKTADGGAPERRGRKHYRRVYYFQRLNGSLALTQYSTFSTIDLIIDRSALWLASRFEGRMWGDSFWITHDVLLMMRANNVSIAPFVVPVLRNIKKHYSNGSYDFVMGATCGLLALMQLLENSCPQACRDAGFGPETIKEISSWIRGNLQAQSTNDKQSALLALSQIDGEPKDEKWIQLKEDIYNGLKLSELNDEHSTEIDVCRHIAMCLECDPKDQRRLRKMLANLAKRQAPSGEWTNTGRTAHVLVFLLENLKALPSGKEESGAPTCEEMIYKGVLSLRAKYNWSSGNWDGDLQATAKATHAIGLYNTQFRYSTQEFLKVIEGESERMQAATLVRELNERLSNLLVQGNEKAAMISTLKETTRRSSSFRNYEYIWRLVSICSTGLLIALVVYLATEDRNRLKEAIRSVGALSLLASLVIGLISGKVIDRITAKKAAGAPDGSKKD